MEKYAELSVLNHGTYGVVQLVRDVRTSRMYAAKRVSLALSSREEIDAEIDVHARVADHPRVVKLVDHFEDAARNEYVLVLEYCSGGDLHDAIAQGSRPSQAGTLRIMLQLLDLVEYCHSRHVYHRDIKPENVFLQRNGSVKLGDWGLATTTRECADFGTGSEQYMAPECFDRTANKYDAEKADIWALGIVLLNLIFGRNPFKQATARDRLFTDFASSRETLYDIFPALTKDVFEVLRHSLTIDPDNRSIPLMREALNRVEVWTTDDEIQKLTARKPKPSVSPPQFDSSTKVVPVPVVHKPFRVPTAVARSLKSPGTPWDRRKMFTPPASRAVFQHHPHHHHHHHHHHHSYQPPTSLPQHLEVPEIEDGFAGGDDRAMSDHGMFAMDQASGSSSSGSGSGSSSSANTPQYRSDDEEEDTLVVGSLDSDSLDEPPEPSDEDAVNIEDGVMDAFAPLGKVGKFERHSYRRKVSMYR